MAPARRQHILDSHPLEWKAPGTIVDLEDRDADLRRARARGHTIGVQKEVPDVCAVAAPVFDHSGRVIAVLSVTGPLQRFNSAARAKLGPEVAALAQQISQRLGYLELLKVEAAGRG